MTWIFQIYNQYDQIIMRLSVRRSEHVEVYMKAERLAEEYVDKLPDGHIVYSKVERARCGDMSVNGVVELDAAIDVINAAIIEGERNAQRAHIEQIAQGVLRAMNVSVGDDEFVGIVDRGMRFIANSVRKTA